MYEIGYFVQLVPELQDILQLCHVEQITFATTKVLHQNVLIPHLPNKSVRPFFIPLI